MASFAIPAAISGAASLGGAVMGGKAQKQAAQLQAQTADKALEFTKQQEAQKLASYNQAVDLWKQQWNAQQARRDALLSSYGFSVPNTGSLSMPTGAPGGSPAGMPVGMPGAAMSPAMAQAPRPAAAVGAAQSLVQPGGSLGAILRNPDAANADIGAWSDWKKYGLA